ncbi:MAG: ribosome maturation factor RimP [Acidimicrobiales bacterium]
MSTTGMVQELAMPVVEGQGLELYDVELVGATLRVLVDGAGGVDLDTLSELSQRLSSALDRADLMPGRYTLEVSSPGLERPLRTRAHFEAVVGSRVRVRTVPGTEAGRRVEGVLAAVDDEGLLIAGDEGGAADGSRLAWDQVERARTVFDWARGRRGSRRRAGP